MDPEEIYRKLDNSILFCYEENTEFCHRHIVAAWLEILLGIKVSEQKIHNYDIEVVDRPQYIKEYLEDAMRKNRNMRQFQCLRALYLFKKEEQLEQARMQRKNIQNNLILLKYIRNRNRISTK